jgi:PAS domain S-box-containing protein
LFKRKDGTKIIGSITASAHFDKNGSVDYIDGVVEDITERKKVQEQAKKLADDWARTFDAISDFVFIQDPDFVITRVNKALCEAFHLGREEIIGKKCFQVLHKTNKPWPGCPFEKTSLDKITHTEEVDDPEIGMPLLVTTSPIFNEQGEFLGSVHIAKNIAMLKNTEVELQKKFHDLERFQKIAVDRELRMKELKERIKELENREIK